MRSVHLFALAFVTLSSLAACGGAAPATPTTPAGDAKPAEAGGALKANGEAKLGDKTKCPVSGEEFTVSSASPSFEYQGKTYYTCCSGCMEKFKADPAKYLGKPKT